MWLPQWLHDRIEARKRRELAEADAVIEGRAPSLAHPGDPGQPDEFM
jgi:hypothetical protein